MALGISSHFWQGLTWTSLVMFPGSFSSHPLSACTFPKYTHIHNGSHTRHFPKCSRPKSQVSNLGVETKSQVSKLEFIHYETLCALLQFSLLALIHFLLAPFHSMHLVLLLARAQLYRDEMHRTISMWKKWIVQVFSLALKAHSKWQSTMKIAAHRQWWAINSKKFPTQRFETRLFGGNKLTK